jgi:hypothetical protein
MFLVKNFRLSRGILLGPRFVLAAKNLLQAICIVSIVGAHHSALAGESNAVSFRIQLKGLQFAPNGKLEVEVLNANQLQALQRQAGCRIIFDLSSNDKRINCPSGITYQEVIPEKFTFNVRDLGQSVSVSSRTVRVGEAYAINLIGDSPDNCNTLRAKHSSTALSANIDLTDLPWWQTSIFCAQKNK